MCTNFGQFLRVLRIKRAEHLMTMANKLMISSSYLSLIEAGNRSIPKSLPYDLIEKYNLTEQEQIEMQKAICSSIKSIDISLENTTFLQKEVALLFSMNLHKMDDIILDELLSLIKKIEC